MSAYSAVRASLLLFFVLCSCGVFLCALSRGKGPLRVIAVVSTLCSGLMMLTAAFVLATGQTPEIPLWNLEGFGPLSLRLDALSSIFLFITGLVYLPASLFVRLQLQSRFNGRYPARRFGVLHFALMGSVVAILSAHDAYSFLISWECMSILCYFLVNFEQRQGTDTRAGYIMLAMSEAGFLCIVVAFLIVGRTAPDFSFSALAAAAATALARLPVDGQASTL